MQFDVTEFRELFPAFADTAQYPDAVLSGYFSSAVCTLGEVWGVTACSLRALYLLTAHFAALSGMVVSGGVTVGPVTSSTVGGVSVTISGPTVRNAWQGWLSNTPYGIELWAMLSVRSAGGWHIRACRRG